MNCISKYTEAELALLKENSLKRKKYKKAKWQQENRNYYADHRAMYYKINKQKIANKKSEYYLKNKDKILEKQSEYDNKNKEDVKKKQAKYYKKTKEKRKYRKILDHQLYTDQSNSKIKFTFRKRCDSAKKSSMKCSIL